MQTWRSYSSLSLSAALEEERGPDAFAILAAVGHLQATWAPKVTRRMSMQSFWLPEMHTVAEDE